MEPLRGWIAFRKIPKALPNLLGSISFLFSFFGSFFSQLFPSILYPLDLEMARLRRILGLYSLPSIFSETCHKSSLPHLKRNLYSTQIRISLLLSKWCFSFIPWTVRILSFIHSFRRKIWFNQSLWKKIDWKWWGIEIGSCKEMVYLGKCNF